MLHPVNSPKKQQDEFVRILRLVLLKWYWVVGSLIVALVIAFLINRYATPIFVVSASVINNKFEDPKSLDVASQVFDGGQYFRQPIDVPREMRILKASDIFYETLGELDLQIKYYLIGRMKTTEVDNPPVALVFSDSSSTPWGLELNIRVFDDNTYGISQANREEWSAWAKGKKLVFGNIYRLNGYKFSVEKTGSSVPDYSIACQVVSMENLVNEYKNRLDIKTNNATSSIFVFSLQSENPSKDLRFLEHYLETIVEKGLENKNLYATNTINFIDQQMEMISDSLLGYRRQIDEFKLNNRQLIKGASFTFQQLERYDSLIAGLQIRNEYLDYLRSYVTDKTESDVFAPIMAGIEYPVLQNFVDQYIDLKLEEEEIIRTEGNQQNPLLKGINNREDKLVQNILEGISNQRSRNIQVLNSYENQSEDLLSSLGGFQTQVRELLELERAYSLNQELFNLLLQKKTEASIARASTTSDYQVLDEPAINRTPISPDKTKHYTYALILGLLLPVGFIYLLDRFNQRINTKEDLERVTDIPIVGLVGHNRLKTSLVIMEKPKSAISESFRSLRTNLQYIVSNGAPNASKVILITSSIGGEGKTFCSVNLAHILALTGKKTLVIGADMRKPAMTDIFNLDGRTGLSNYLAGMSELDEVLHTVNSSKTLMTIPAGDVPPNPSELLISDRMRSLMEELKEKFDYIVIDTPPIGIVTDAMQLTRYADANIIVVRQGMTTKPFIESIEQMYQQKQLKNLVILFNDVNFRQFGYEKYGYGYRSGYYTK